MRRGRNTSTGSRPRRAPRGWRRRPGALRRSWHPPVHRRPAAPGCRWSCSPARAVPRRWSSGASRVSRLLPFRPQASNEASGGHAGGAERRPVAVGCACCRARHDSSARDRRRRSRGVQRRGVHRRGMHGLAVDAAHGGRRARRSRGERRGTAPDEPRVRLLSHLASPDVPVAAPARRRRREGRRVRGPRVRASPRDLRRGG